MKARIVKFKLEIVGVIVGAISGWCYWYFVGCASGSCLITSSPVNSSIYGGVMGGLLFSILKKETNKQNGK